jgi:excisionase family DNA binding protein
MLHFESADIRTTHGEHMQIEHRELQREGLSIAEACAVAGIGRTKIYEAITEGSLKARKCGKRTLVLRDDLRDFLASLPGAA